MVDYISVQSNWTSINSVTLDLVCDVDIDEKNQLTDVEKQEDENLRTTVSDEKITHITLRSNQTDQHEDPILTLRFLQPNKYHLQSIQFLSNAKHIEFYHKEYLGSCQGSRITELNQDSIYESIYEFNQSYETLSLKCLKLANTTDLIIYCLQISLKKLEETSSSISKMNLPFDLNRVRSMIDETNLSSNARQFMNNLQHIQEHRQIREYSGQQFNLNQMMLMMKGLNSSSFDPTHSTSTSLPPTLEEAKSPMNKNIKCTCAEDQNTIKQEFDALEIRLQSYINGRFCQLQQHIDKRFDQLEEKLTQMK